jgi:GH24 family phage-related lysozyme (muramidase)
MEYNVLTEQEYNRRLRSVIVGSEGLHERVQDVGDGRATIGWGYTFNRNNNAAIWQNAGIELSQEQRRALASIDAAPAADKTRLGLAFSKAVNESESDQLLRASLREYERPASSVNMPLSDERVALVSITYNRGVGAVRGNPAANRPEHPVMNAIRDGDRAEAWFQLRYNCWGSNQALEDGLRKRRFAEAEVFGLYDDSNNVSQVEALGVYRMYRQNRDEISRVERNFGETIDGVEARPNRIAQANRDYPDLISEYGNVQTISEAMAPAKTVVLAHLRAQHPELARQMTEANFNQGRLPIDLARNRDFPGQDDHPPAAANEPAMQRTHPVPQREPLSYLDQAHPDHRLFQHLRERLPAQVSDDKVAELTLAARQGRVQDAERVKEMGISNDRAYVFGPLGTIGAVVDLRTPAPPMAETMRQAEVVEQQQGQSMAQFQEQQRHSHERGGRAMA